MFFGNLRAGRKEGREMDLKEASELEEKGARFPPKIRRAILLYVHGFPTTPYRVFSMKNAEKAAEEIRAGVEGSRYGIVVRATSDYDGPTAMGQPYLWARCPEEVTPEAVRRLGSSYLMAFAPKATPETAKGIVVGRCAHMYDRDTTVVEYYLDEIRPRVLERVDHADPRFGMIVRNPGRFFRNERGGCAHTGEIVRILGQYERSARALAENTRASEICLEFTWHRGRIEFHDFDRRRA